MMTSLERYILRQCFGVMIFVTAALSAAIWLAQSLRLIDLIVNRGLSIEVFLYLALLILPRFLDIVLPIGVFIAVLFTFNRLAAESELVVMRSAGLSHLALAKPVLIADKLTIYIRSRDEQGEVFGLLINDNREPHRPVTILAERGVFADMSGGSRIVMVNGNRQQFDPETHKLSLLTFDRYTLDLDSLHDAPIVRFREAQERFLGELFFPPSEADLALRLGFMVEAHQRILIPLSALSFSLIPLACLLPGEFNRRGQLKRALLAIVIAFLFELLDIGVNDLASRSVAAIPLMYATNLLPFILGLGILMRGNIRLGLRRPRVAAVSTP